jgi:hypothetical protein
MTYAATNNLPAGWPNRFFRKARVKRAKTE